MSLKNVVLGIAIIILTILVTVNGIRVFYPEIEYSDYCDEFRNPGVLDTESKCDDAGGKWTAFTEPVVKGSPDGYCDVDFYCREDFQDASEVRSKNVFIIALVVGIILIGVGAFLFGLEAVGTGLMGGGVGTIIYGVGGYWQYSSDVLRFGLSLAGLILVIGFAYWFNRKMKGKPLKSIFGKSKKRR